MTKAKRICPECSSLYEVGGEICNSECSKGQARLYQRVRYHIRLANRGRLDRRATAMWRRYGITEEDYNLLRHKQNYSCAICNCSEDEIEDRKMGRPRADGSKNVKLSARLVVDHNHQTGVVRGLLCHFCNLGLSSFRDRPDYLTNAALYLNKDSTNNL